MSQKLSSLKKKLVIGHHRQESSAGEGSPEVITLTPKTLLRHMMALGSSGSGKTVLSKVIVEEMLRLNIPAICIDPQGDLCSLALNVAEGDLETLIEKGVHPELAQQFSENAEVVIFSPAARRGVPLCADPFYSDPTQLKGQDRVQAITSVATMVTSLLGYDISSDDGEGLVAAFDHHLTQLARQKKYPRSLDQFSQMLSALDEMGDLARFIDERKLDAALRKLARLDVGARRLLFHEGLPLNIDLLLGRGEDANVTPGKTRLSIIYLNSLNSAEDKDFFIAALAEQLYTWMLQHPSKTPQALFYIDEVAPFIPPVRKPACKEALTLIFKQARKYGVCCLMATQNPGDVDYKAMAQFGTWAIGRLTTRQDLKKVQPTLKSLDPVRTDEIMDALPSLQAGEFALISPDNFDKTLDLKTRWLYTMHETLDERRIEEVSEPRRASFEALEERLKGVREESIEEEWGRDDREDEGEARGEEKTGKTSKKNSSSKKKSTPSAEELDDASLEDHREESPEDDDDERVMELLSTHDTLDAKGLANLMSCSSSKARKLLNQLEASDRVRSYKEGRSMHYFSMESGARPDLGLGHKVKALIPKLTQAEIITRAESLRGKSVLGLFGDEEEFLNRKLIYHGLYQVNFTEHVEAGFISSLFGDNTKRVEDAIYLEPETLKIFQYQPGAPIKLIDQPTCYASEIKDFDGVAEITNVSPSSIAFDEEAWQKRQSTQTVEDSVKRRFKLKILSVNPIFMPVWILRYQVKGSHQVRTLHVDGLTGHPIHF